MFHITSILKALSHVTIDLRSMSHVGFRNSRVTLELDRATWLFRSTRHIEPNDMKIQISHTT